MEPITVILIVVAVLLLIGSCFLPAKDTEATAVDYDEIVRRLAKRELTPEEQERLRQTVDGIIVVYSLATHIVARQVLLNNNLYLDLSVSTKRIG